MSDGYFLNWLADRLVHAYGEDEHVDFVSRLRRIAAATPASTPSLGTLPRCPKCKSADIIRIDHNRAECMACHHKDLMFNFPRAAQSDRQAQDAEMLLASATDLLNSWAREAGVEQAQAPEDIRGVIDRLWSNSTRRQGQ